MSNVIKSGVTSSNGYRIIKPKPIREEEQELVPENHENEELLLEEIEHNQAKKAALVVEIQDLQKQLTELREQLNIEQNDAKREIEQWWEKNRLELESHRLDALQHAKKQGFEEGYQQGYTKIQEEFKNKLEEMTQTVRLAYEHKERIIQDAEPFLLALSIKLAERILNRELEISKEQTVAMVQAGLKQVKERGQVIIEAAPQAYPILISHLEELEQYLDDTQELKIIPGDISSVSSGCLIHTEHGTYDVTIDHQLQVLKNQLLALFEESVSDA